MNARTTADAISRTLAAGYQITGARATGVYLLSPSGVDIRGRGVQERDIDRYLSIGDGDPLLRHLVAEQTAVHDRMLFDARAWRKLALFDVAVAPAGLCHYLLAPILQGGTVIGAVTCGSALGGPPFGIRDLLRATTLASYLAARMCLDAREPALDCLRPRHQDVAMLVAKGFTNDEIARLLGVSASYIKKILKQLFRSFDVSTRAELAGLVARGASPYRVM